MTPRDILVEIRAAGGDLRVVDGKLSVVRRHVVPDALVSVARENAAGLRAILAEHVSTGSATEAVIAAQRLLRSRRWQFEPAPCDFPIGPAGRYCERCGAPFLTHHDPRRGRAR